jgi:glyoxylase-like metal-dependent hydrolase (beta-lactamase superfamily II)
MMRRLLTVLAVLTVLPMAAAGANPYGALPIEVTFEKVPDAPVYYTVGYSGVPDSGNAGHTSNAGFVVTGEGVVVFDALGTPALGYAMLAKIREVTDQPVRALVVSHYHADHVYGLQAFREHAEEVVIRAQQRVREYFNPQGFKRGEDARRRLEQRREALFPWVDEGTYLVEPDRLFGQSERFTLGGLTFQLRHMGPAHAPGDSMMVVPELGVVFSGDIIYKGRIPFLDSPQVDTANWLAGLEHLTAMEPPPAFVIPGHGEPSADVDEAVSFTRGYLRFVRSEMKAAVRDFTPFAQAYEAVDWSPYLDMPAFEASNRGNAYRVYLEMEESGF